MGWKKGTKITDPKVLERLQKARVKALETRRANAQKRKAEKELKDLEKKKSAKLVQEKLEKLKSSPPDDAKNEQVDVEDAHKPVEKETKKPKLKRKKKVRFVEAPNSSSSESSDEIVIRRRKPRRRRRRRYSYAEYDVQEQPLRQPPKPLETPPREEKSEKPMPPPAPRKSRRELALDALYKKAYGKRFR